jgi:Ser/Thr protein kinase RdoA (MazF antagonist)
MRTTVDINDDLLIELKRVAAECRPSLKELVEDAIHSSFADVNVLFNAHREECERHEKLRA